MKIESYKKCTLVWITCSIPLKMSLYSAESSNESNTVLFLNELIKTINKTRSSLWAKRDARLLVHATESFSNKQETDRA